MYDDDMEEEIVVFDLEVSGLFHNCMDKRTNYSIGSLSTVGVTLFFLPEDLCL